MAFTKLKVLVILTSYSNCYDSLDYCTCTIISHTCFLPNYSMQFITRVVSNQEQVIMVRTYSIILNVLNVLIRYDHDIVYFSYVDQFDYIYICATSTDSLL